MDEFLKSFLTGEPLPKEQKLAMCVLLDINDMPWDKQQKMYKSVQKSLERKMDERRYTFIKKIDILQKISLGKLF